MTEGQRLTPGCLYDYPEGRRVRPVLKCVAHPGCPREVVPWREGLLAEMLALGKLTGAARRDGEAEGALVAQEGVEPGMDGGEEGGVGEGGGGVQHGPR